MATTITVPNEYGYVLATTASTFFLAFWHGMRVTGFRKQAHVAYPKSFADSGDLAAAKDEKEKKALYLFNCAQRAHGNFLENAPFVVASMLVAGLQYPLWTTGLGLVWSASRIVYAVGYTREDKDKGQGRLYGSGFWFCQLGLYGLTAWTGIKMVL